MARAKRKTPPPDRLRDLIALARLGALRCALDDPAFGVKCSELVDQMEQLLIPEEEDSCS